MTLNPQESLRGSVIEFNHNERRLKQLECNYSTVEAEDPIYSFALDNYSWQSVYSYLD